MAQINMDLSRVQAHTSRDPLPPGDYQVKVIDSDVVMTKSGKPMLKVEMAVEDNGMGLPVNLIGRRVWEQFVLENEVAQSRLKGLASAGGHPHPDTIRDSEELHGLRLIVRLKVKQDEQYGPRNEISSFKAIAPTGSSFSSAPAPVATAPVHAPALPANPLPQAATAPAMNKMPWDK